MKYLGVMITENLNTIHELNYCNVTKETQKDLERWNTLLLDFSSRIDIVKINILPRFLYLFQSLLIKIPR